MFCFCRLEYPGVSPQLSFLKDTERAEFYSATDKEAVDGMSRNDNINYNYICEASKFCNNLGSLCNIVCLQHT